VRRNFLNEFFNYIIEDLSMLELNAQNLTKEIPRL
jgi:hypothetical protein